MERKEQRQVLLLREEFEYNHEDDLWCRCLGPLTTNLVTLRQIINAAFLVYFSFAVSPWEVAFIGKSGFSFLLAEQRLTMRNYLINGQYQWVRESTRVPNNVRVGSTDPNGKVRPEYTAVKCLPVSYLSGEHCFVKSKSTTIV